MALHDGDMLVVEYMNHRLQCIDHKNRPLWTLGERGSADGQFEFPEAMLLVHDSARLFVVDSNNHRIQVFDLEGSDAGEKKVGVGGGGGVTRRPAADVGGGNGGASVALPRAMSTRCDDRPCYVYTQSLGATEAAGSKGGTGAGEFKHPRSIAIDGTGKLFVTDGGNHRVSVFAPNLAFAGNFCSHGTGAGQLSHPHGVTVDERDLVYVADTHNARVCVFTNAMEPILSIGGLASASLAPAPTLSAAGGDVGGSPWTFLEPYSVMFEPHSSQLFVTDRGRHELHTFRVDPGPLLQTKPSYAHKRTVGAKGWRCGQFNYPYGMCVDDDGEVYVADGFNHRIVVCDGKDTSAITTIGQQGARLGHFSYPIAVHKHGSGHYSEDGAHSFEPKVPHSALLQRD